MGWILWLSKLVVEGKYLDIQVNAIKINEYIFRGIFVYFMTSKSKTLPSHKPVHSLCKAFKPLVFHSKMILKLSYMLKRIITLFRGYVSTPSILEKFCSNFRFLKFSVWTLEKYNVVKSIWNWMAKWISIKFAHFWGIVKT